MSNKGDPNKREAENRQMQGQASKRFDQQQIWISKPTDVLVGGESGMIPIEMVSSLKECEHMYGRCFQEAIIILPRPWIIISSI